MERHYDPVIVFSFSKRECEQYALQLAKLDFTSEEEKALIEQARGGQREGDGRGEGGHGAGALPRAVVDRPTSLAQVFVNAMDSLSEDDRRLPQIDSILPLLRRGIGIHHGGLLPILKEVIEILFQESLLKILFATETFSMGEGRAGRESPWGGRGGPL